jgi:hypothetical protein
LLDTSLQLCNQQARRVRLLQGTSNGYSARQQRTFVLVAERLVLPHQLVTLRLHVLDFVMVLGEGAIKF